MLTFMAYLRAMDATQDSLNLANTHYENFPVASFLLPMRLRRPIGLIYALRAKPTILPTRGIGCRSSAWHCSTATTGN